jgi:hypothetical protein
MTDTQMDTLTVAPASIPSRDTPVSVLVEILARWGKEDANDVLSDMEARIAAVVAPDSGFLTIQQPKFHWSGRKNGIALQWNRVTLGGVHHSPANPGDVGPWFGYVGQGYPNPFEGYFNSEEEAKEMVERAALHLLGLGPVGDPA